MMTERRRSALTLGLIATTLSIVTGWLLLDAVAVVAAVARSVAPAIRVDSGDATMLMLWPIIVGLSVIAFLESFGPDRGDGKTAGNLWSTFFRITLVLLPLALAAPFAYRAWSASKLTSNGYLACENSGSRGRYPSTLFVRSPSLCDTSNR